MCGAGYLVHSWHSEKLLFQHESFVLRLGPLTFSATLIDAFELVLTSVLVAGSLAVSLRRCERGLALAVVTVIWVITGGLHSFLIHDPAITSTALALIAYVFYRFRRDMQTLRPYHLLQITNVRWLPWVFAVAAIGVTLVSHFNVYRATYFCTDVQSQIAQGQLLARGELKLHISQSLRDVISFPYATPLSASYSQFPPGQIMIYAGFLRAGMSFWIFDMLVVAGMVLGAMRLAAQIAGRTAMLVTGLLLIGSPHVFGMAGSGMNHNLTACLLVWTAVLWCRPVSPPRAAVGGFLLAYAMATRPLTAMVQGGVWAARFAVGLQKNEPFSRLAIVTAAALGATGPIAGLLVYNYLTTGSAFVLPYSVRDPDFHKLGFRAAGPFAYSISDAVNNLLADIVAWNWMLFGWPVSSWFALLPWWITTRFSRRETLLLAIIISQVLVYRYYHHHDHSFGPRFLYEVVPFLVVLAAVGIARVGHRWANLRVTLFVLILGFAVHGLTSAQTFWSARHSIPVASIYHLRSMVKQYWPPRQPTIFVVPRDQIEPISQWFLGPYEGPPVWFVEMADELKARKLPDLQDYQFIRIGAE